MVEKSTEESLDTCYTYKHTRDMTITTRIYNDVDMCGVPHTRCGTRDVPHARCSTHAVRYTASVYNDVDMCGVPHTHVITRTTCK